MKSTFWQRLADPALARLRSLPRLLERVRSVREGRWEADSHASAQGLLLFAPLVAPRREYRLYLPAAYGPDRRLPLVVMLHGCQQDPESFAAGTGMNRLADRHGFLVLYPGQSLDANPQRCWNWFDPSIQHGGGEAAIVAAMVEKVAASHHVDPTRIYVAGMSAGGALASALACRHPRLFAAAAVHSGLPFVGAHSLRTAQAALERGLQFDPAAVAWRTFQREEPGPMPVIVLHGSLDAQVNPLNAEQLVRQFAWINGLWDPQTAAGPRPTRVANGRSPGGYEYNVADYVSGERLRLRKVMVAGLGHAWSGGDGRLPYNDSQGPDASEMIWDFFCLHTRAEQPVLAAAEKESS